MCDRNKNKMKFKRKKRTNSEKIVYFTRILIVQMIYKVLIFVAHVYSFFFFSILSFSSGKHSAGFWFDFFFLILSDRKYHIYQRNLPIDTFAYVYNRNSKYKNTHTNAWCWLYLISYYFFFRFNFIVILLRALYSFILLCVLLKMYCCVCLCTMYYVANILKIT